MGKEQRPHGTHTPGSLPSLLPHSPISLPPTCLPPINVKVGLTAGLCTQFPQACSVGQPGLGLPEYWFSFFFSSPLPSYPFLPCLLLSGPGEGPNISKEHTRTVSGELEPRLVPLPSGEEGVNADELCIWVLGGRSGLLRTSPRSQSQVLGGKRSYSILLPRRGRCPILLIPPALPRMFAKKKK